MKIEAIFHASIGDFLLDAKLSVPARGITALTGPSGCGKTTLLRAIAGLDRHPNGIVRIGDETWQDGSTFVPPHHRAMGVVFQDSNLLPHLTARGNIDYGVRRMPKATQHVDTNHVIQLMGIAHLLDRKPDQLSGGERRRVAIGRALAVHPRILLMDEPLTGLDAASKREVLPYLMTLREELDIPVLLVSHSTEDVARLADHLVLMENGRILADGDTSTMFTSLDLPLAHTDTASAIIDAVISGYDEAYHLSKLDFEGGQCFVPGERTTPGDRVRLRIAARDVSLTLQRQPDTSILNIIPAVVEEVFTETQGQVMVRLQAGGVTILSRITKKSFVALGLQCGVTVFAQIKSVSFVT